MPHSDDCTRTRTAWTDCAMTTIAPKPKRSRALLMLSKVADELRAIADRLSQAAAT